MGDGLTRDSVLDAAMGLLADGGLHALAMRRIAGALGVQQSALYWYFENKQAILAAVADRLLDSVEMAPLTDEGWPERILGQASRLRDGLLPFPDGAELVATAFAFRLGAQRPHQQFATILTDAGFGSDRADIGASVLFHFVIGYVTDEQQHRQAAALGAIKDAPELDQQDATRRFGRGVELIVAGLIATGGS